MSANSSNTFAEYKDSSGPVPLIDQPRSSPPPNSPPPPFLPEPQGQDLSNHPAFSDKSPLDMRRSQQPPPNDDRIVVSRRELIEFLKKNAPEKRPSTTPPPEEDGDKKKKNDSQKYLIPIGVSILVVAIILVILGLSSKRKNSNPQQLYPTAQQILNAQQLGGETQ